MSQNNDTNVMQKKSILMPWEIDLYATTELFIDMIPFTTAGLYYLVFKWMLWRSRKEEAL